MKLESKDIAGWIGKAGKTERTKEFEYPHILGFFVLITYGSKFILNQIRELARDPRADTSPQGGERILEPKLNQGYARWIIRGWSGLTLERLEEIIPGVFEEGMEQAKEQAPEGTPVDIEKLKKAEVEFSEVTCIEMFDSSVEFSNWVVRVSGDTKKYADVGEKKAEEYENLKKSQR